MHTSAVLSGIQGNFIAAAILQAHYRRKIGNKVRGEKIEFALSKVFLLKLLIIYLFLVPPDLFFNSILSFLFLHFSCLKF